MGVDSHPQTVHVWYISPRFTIKINHMYTVNIPYIYKCYGIQEVSNMMDINMSLGSYKKENLKTSNISATVAVFLAMS